MANSPFDANPAFTKLGEDSRKAVIQAFDAMSNWRSELAEISEKNSDAVFDKMSEAAKALGWPTEFVELSRKQMQNASRMQLQAVDQVMGHLGKSGKIARNAGPISNSRASRICRASEARAVLRKSRCRLRHVPWNAGSRIGADGSDPVLDAGRRDVAEGLAAGDVDLDGCATKRHEQGRLFEQQDATRGKPPTRFLNSGAGFAQAGAFNLSACQLTQRKS